MQYNFDFYDNHDDDEFIQYIQIYKVENKFMKSIIHFKEGRHASSS